MTPGGLHVSGVYLYQLSGADWFEGGVGFSFGGGGAACFRDRDDRFLCDHGIASGFAGGLSAGVRRFLSSRQSFTPYLHGGVEVRFVSFPGDGVRGVAVPVWLGAGVRARVADNVTIAGGARYLAGVGWLNHKLGAEPQAALIIAFGVEFCLD